MRYLNRLALGAATLTATAAMGLSPVYAQPPAAMKAITMSSASTKTVPYPDTFQAPSRGLRVATFNASLNRANQGQLQLDLAGPNDAQAQAVAEVVQRNAPDILLLNEFDYDEAGNAADLFKANYLSVPQRGQQAIDYPYVYLAPSNTGIQSGADLDGDGIIGGPADALGYGDFEGQFAMVLFSKYPIDAANARTFQGFLWKDMPNSQLPTDHYDELVQGVLPLASKSMWDVPVKVGAKTIHVIAAHPTPPVFDGPEKRNQRRNHDEIRLISDYVTGGKNADYMYDDKGVAGGLKPSSNFVIMGDLNSDVSAGESDPAAIGGLLGNPLLTDPAPASERRGAADSAGIGRGGVDLNTLGTADFGRVAQGVLRVDYVLPSATLPIRDAGVYWPAPGQSGFDLVGGWPPSSSDHRLVWVNLDIPV